MDTAISIGTPIVALLLLIFGGWIILKAVQFILKKYDWKLSVQGDGQRLVESEDARTSVNPILTNLNNIIKDASLGTRREAFAAKEGEDGDDGNTSGDDDSDTDDTNKGNTLEGVAKVIEALPGLLNASFGPIVVVLFTGILVMGGGYYLLYLLANSN